MQNSDNITLKIKKIITVGFMGRGVVDSIKGFSRQTYFNIQTDFYQ